jgi:hypothetical protein
MDKQRIAVNSFVALKSQIKIYHTPQFKEWGNLEDLTKGTGGQWLSDSDGSSSWKPGGQFSPPPGSFPSIPSGSENPVPLPLNPGNPTPTP